MRNDIVFRSVASLAGNAGAARRQKSAAVERSGFVIVEIQGIRFALGVEVVERVLRRIGEAKPVEYRGVVLPSLDFSDFFSGDAGACNGQWIAIVGGSTLGGDRWALPVDSVIDVAMVDTSLIFPLPREDAATPQHVHARFKHRGEWVYVVDMGRVVLAKSAGSC